MAASIDSQRSATQWLFGFSLVCLALVVPPLAGQKIPEPAGQRTGDDDGFWKTASLREHPELNPEALSRH